MAAEQWAELVERMGCPVFQCGQEPGRGPLLGLYCHGMLKVVWFSETMQPSALTLNIFVNHSPLLATPMTFLRLILFVGLWQIANSQYEMLYGACLPQHQQYIRQCAIELKQLGALGDTPANTALIWDHLRRTSKEYFIQMCNAYRRFEQCIAPYKRQCWFTEPIKGEFAVATEALAFSCLDGFYGKILSLSFSICLFQKNKVHKIAVQGMLNNWDCLIRVLTRGEVADCENRMLKDSQVFLNQPQESLYFNPTDINSCRALQDFITCIKYPVQGQCGEDAWQHVREAAQRQTRVYLPYCTLTGSRFTISLFTLFICLLINYLK
ncbi:hypothetical protein T01_12170 [Trichinella spiralis]|uniref:Uncharacterized protein n=2 Tax=Trichinella spiralis TaxID=6334 RepID=A0A0V1B5J6_TRISP|nr:hypothetical protein T01_12170 [Trichinella spiralis]